MNFILFSHSSKVQRTLAVPVLLNTECEVRSKDAQAGPALSRALARVLNATESKENERDEEHSDTDMEESAKSTKPSGKTQILLKVFIVALAGRSYWNASAHTYLILRGCEGCCIKY